MKKIIFGIAFLVISSFILFTQDKVFADSSDLTIEEVDSEYIKGTYSREGTIEVFKNDKFLGSGETVNHSFYITFNQPITQTKLTIYIKDKGGTTETKYISYSPAVLNEVNDKLKILSGTAVPGSKIYGMVGDTPLILKTLDNTTGIFEFQPSNLLSKGTVIKVVSEMNEIKSIISTKVIDAPAPKKPIISPVSNKDTVIKGEAEPNSTVYAVINNVKTYSVKLQNSIFQINLSNSQPLAAGTSVSFYVIDSAGRKSDTVTLKVLDKIAPSVPIVNAITDKTLLITGKAEANAIIQIYKNNKYIGQVKVSSLGKFSYRNPLQHSKTIFDFAAIDSSNNKSGKKRMIVSPKRKPKKVLLSTPVVRQMPELPRGCEVTSLTMLLRHAGVRTDKMALAAQIKKDPSKYIYFNGKIQFGNPLYGFVGNMYTFRKPGFGVYNKPVEALALKYLPNRIVNLTGNSFDEVLNYVSAGRPVWIITTSWFKYVPSQYWQTWYTLHGPVRITMKEHSVLVTGYDEKNVYFNDPLDGVKNKKKPLKDFIAGWKQFGNQAISYY